LKNKIDSKMKNGLEGGLTINLKQIEGLIVDTHLSQVSSLVK